jgi:methionine-rich copper-binding protein CopC
MTLRNRLRRSVSAPRPARQAGIVAALVLGFGALFAAPASAHTQLVSSNPAKNATVSTLPEVTLTFNEHVKLVKVAVRDAKGGTHQSGAPVVTGATVTEKVTGALPAGQYEISYHVVSADGHPVDDTIPFQVAAVALGASPSASTGDVGAQQDGAGAANLQASGDPGTGGQGGPAGAPTSTASSGNGSTKWFIVGACLLAGIGIGLGIVVLRNRKKQPSVS